MSTWERNVVKTAPEIKRTEVLAAVNQLMEVTDRLQKSASSLITAVDPVLSSEERPDDLSIKGIEKTPTDKLWIQIQVQVERIVEVCSTLERAEKRVQL